MDSSTVAITPLSGTAQDLGAEPFHSRVELFMRARTDLLLLDPLEGGGQLSLLLRRQHALGHDEQDVVLFGDVGAQQGRVFHGRRAPLLGSRRITCGKRFGGAGHVADQGSAALMLVQHHTHGPSVAREALALEQGEQQLLLLAVVAAVGEDFEELEEFTERLGAHGRAGQSAAGDFLGKVEHSQNRGMFAAQDGRGILHDFLSSGSVDYRDRRIAEPRSLL
jgi:hypothetical protein